MSATEVREYSAEARSTDVFGRVLCDAREQHFVIDGPVWNGCPGESPNPGEAFLAGVAACGVELIQMFAADRGLELGRVEVRIRGVLDRENPVREDLSVFNRVWMRIAIAGVDEELAAELVDGFKRRCPLYGSVAVSAAKLDLEVVAG